MSNILSSKIPAFLSAVGVSLVMASLITGCAANPASQVAPSVIPSGPKTEIQVPPEFLKWMRDNQVNSIKIQDEKDGAFKGPYNSNICYKIGNYIICP